MKSPTFFKKNFFYINDFFPKIKLDKKIKYQGGVLLGGCSGFYVEHYAIVLGIAVRHINATSPHFTDTGKALASLDRSNNRSSKLFCALARVVVENGVPIYFVLLGLSKHALQGKL